MGRAAQEKTCPISSHPGGWWWGCRPLKVGRSAPQPSPSKIQRSNEANAPPLYRCQPCISKAQTRGEFVPLGCREGRACTLTWLEGNGRDFPLPCTLSFSLLSSRSFGLSIPVKFKGGFQSRGPNGAQLLNSRWLSEVSPCHVRPGE